LSNTAYGLILAELERADSGIRSFCSVQTSLVMGTILLFGSEAQKSAWIPRLGRGEAIGCFGLTEADAGSNPGAMLTTAKRTQGGWVLNGSKRWITNGTLAEVAIVWAKTDDGVRGFLVNAKTPGYSARVMHGKLSMRASDTAELFFEDCALPEDALLPASSGLKSALMALTQARFGIAWGAIGAAIGSFECARDYAASRVQFAGRPIASHQIIQAHFAEMATEITKAQLIAWRLGQLKDAGKMTHVQVSLAKRNNVRMALDVSRRAREILGANGVCDDYPPMRHAANLESVYTYEGTHDIHTLVLGKALTGIDAFA
jgi:glutaryl-CoA dehydrogenase